MGWIKESSLMDLPGNLLGRLVFPFQDERFFDKEMFRLDCLGDYSPHFIRWQGSGHTRFLYSFRALSKARHDGFILVGTMTDVDAVDLSVILYGPCVT